MGKAAISLTTGLGTPKVTVAFLVAVGAAESGRPTIMFLTKGKPFAWPSRGTPSGGVRGCPSLDTLMQRYAAAGGTMIACGICVDAKGIDADSSSTTRPRRAQSSSGVDRRPGVRRPSATEGGAMFIDTTAPEDAAADFRKYMEQQRQAWGFLPDYVGCFAARPNVALAWSALSRTVATSMPRRRYELVTIAAARARKSSYCAVATRPSSATTAAATICAPLRRTQPGQPWTWLMLRSSGSRRPPRVTRRRSGRRTSMGCVGSG